MHVLHPNLEAQIIFKKITHKPNTYKQPLSIRWFTFFKSRGCTGGSEHPQLLWKSQRGQSTWAWEEWQQQPSQDCPVGRCRAAAGAASPGMLSLPDTSCRLPGLGRLAPGQQEPRPQGLWTGTDVRDEFWICWCCKTFWEGSHRTRKHECDP